MFDEPIPVVNDGGFSFVVRQIPSFYLFIFLSFYGVMKPSKIKAYRALTATKTLLIAPTTLLIAPTTLLIATKTLLITT